jgi:endonuclease V-like protein UPF0215 family
MKDEVRVLGIDDSPFEQEKQFHNDVMVVGTVFRGGKFLDGVLSTYVEKDGDDATIQLIKLINDSKFKSQLQAIFLDGIAMAGFNVINCHLLHEKTGLPVLIVSRTEPDRASFKKALRKLDMDYKTTLIDEAPEPRSYGNVYVQAVGDIDVEALLDICTTRSDLPEAIRVAHIIASGVVGGESRGDA